MDRPSVSVIIPCYNAAQWVGQAIQSAMDQTYPHKEVIVIDDGSTDTSLDIIQSFGNRIKWETGPHRGGNHARNRGIQLAQGEWIQFLDADDVLMPAKLDFQIPVASRTARTLVFTDWFVFKEKFDSSSARTLSVRKERCDSLELLLDLAPPLHISAPLHRKSLLQDVGLFNVDLPCCQDLDLHLRIAGAGVDFQRLPGPLFAVREISSSLSRSNYERILDYQAPVLLGALTSFLQSARLTQERRRIVARAMAKSSRHYARLGRWAKANERLAAARQIDIAGAASAFTVLYRIAMKVGGFRVAEGLVRCRSALAWRQWQAIRVIN